MIRIKQMEMAAQVLARLRLMDIVGLAFLVNVTSVGMGFESLLRLVMIRFKQMDRDVLLTVSQCFPPGYAQEELQLPKTPVILNTGMD